MTWEERLKDQPDILWSIIGDIVKIMKSTDSPRRVGRRPSVDGMSMDELWKLLYPEQFTMDPFPIALRDLMERTGTSERALARKIPCSQPMINRWVRGLRKISLGDLERIAAALRVPPSYFVEYRARKFASLVESHFMANPNASIAVAKALKS